MPREARKAPGILKNNHMESAAKALNSVVGTNSGDTVTPDTPKVTLERKFLPYYDPNNSPSQDDDDNSTSYSSYPDMKVWAKKESKTVPVSQYSSNWKIPLAQADASVSAGSSTTTAETSNYAGGVTGTTCASVVQSSARKDVFHHGHPYNHNDDDDDDDGDDDDDDDDDDDAGDDAAKSGSEVSKMQSDSKPQGRFTAGTLTTSFKVN